MVTYYGNQPSHLLDRFSARRSPVGVFLPLQVSIAVLSVVVGYPWRVALLLRLTVQQFFLGEGGKVSTAHVVCPVPVLTCISTYSN